MNEQPAWAALVDTCQSGVLDALRGALHREFLTEDQVKSVVDNSGSTDLSRLLKNAVLADNGISAPELDCRLEAQLFKDRVERGPAHALATGTFWAGLGSVVKVSYERELDSGPPRDTRCYICSYPAAAPQILKAARDHWGIENTLHWVLDVAFDEDRSRVRTGHADQNLAVIRHLALNLNKHKTSVKVGIKAKRKKAAWDHDYLLKIISQ